MRTRIRTVLAVASLIILIFAASPPAAADHPAPEDGVDHLNVVVNDVAPGDEHTLEVLSLTHGGLRPGWIYILYGFAQGNHSLLVDFRHGEEVLETWTWTANEFTTNITKIRREGVHEVVIRNPSPETMRYAFYYDQSCNCANKVIPLPGGVALFNNPYPADTDVSISFPLVADWHVYGALALHDDERENAHWPDDFLVLQEKEASGPGSDRSGHGWLNFTFHTAESRMYYVYLKAIEGADPDDPIHLTPIYDVGSAETAGESPALGLALLLALLAVTALGVRARRAWITRRA